MCLDGWIIFWGLFWFVLLPSAFVCLIIYLIIRYRVRDTEPDQPLPSERS